MAIAWTARSPPLADWTREQDVEGFRRNLARRLRWWFTAIPAGIGMATARSCIKLRLGVSPSQSGVWSAGNGAAMRAPILGVAASDLSEMCGLVIASSLITHRDPRAIARALAIALAARHAARGGTPGASAWLGEVKSLPQVAGSPLVALLERAITGVGRGMSTTEFATEMGLADGVTSFVMHSVPVAIHAWLRYSNQYAQGLKQAILCGGETDSVAFLVGSLIGTQVSGDGIPPSWIEFVGDWPLSIAWMERLARQPALAESPAERATPNLSFGAVALRNAFFHTIVLGHGIRCCAPPY